MSTETPPDHEEDIWYKNRVLIAAVAAAITMVGIYVYDGARKRSAEEDLIESFQLDKTRGKKVYGELESAPPQFSKPTPGHMDTRGGDSSLDNENRPIEKRESGLPLPSTSDSVAVPDLPATVGYLIIGAGTSALSAARAIRAKDPKSKVLLIGEEPHPPYMRPPLSKELWWMDDGSEKDDDTKLKFKMWNGKERSVFFEQPEFFCTTTELNAAENGGVGLVTGHRVDKLDAVRKVAHLDNGQTIGFDKCLLATGGRPKRLDVLERASKENPEVRDKVTRFRTIADFRRLTAALADLREKNKSVEVAVIGGGFLGTEMTCALASQAERTGIRLTQIFPEAGVLGLVLPHYLSQWTSRKMERLGPVEMVSGVSLEGVGYNRRSGKVVLHLSSGREVECDHVVQAVGLQPRTELARASNLEVCKRCGGICANAELQARSSIWVAGDCVCFYDEQLGRRRVEHHEHAVVSGRLAGENMSAVVSKLDTQPYQHQSMFWSDLGPTVGFEAIGLVDSTLQTVGVFTKATEADNPRAVVGQTGESLRSVSETEQVAASFEQTSPKAKEQPHPQDLFRSVNIDDELKGVVFYLRNEVIVGVLLWNVFGKMPVARKLVKDQVKHGETDGVQGSASLTEVAKLFDLYSSFAQVDPGDAAKK